MNLQQKRDKKFWLENISDLFSNTQIIPVPEMSLEEQLNALTRFVIIIFLCMIIFGNLKMSFIFLILSLLFIIILYYIQKNTMRNKENYEYNPETKTAPKNIPINHLSNSCNDNSNCLSTNTVFLPTDMNAITQDYLRCKNKTRQPQCNDESIISFGKDYVSDNQKLVGKANPKTLIPPIITPPLADLDYWRANNLINHSHINTESQHDEYLSGYQISNCCDNSTKKQYSNYIDQNQHIENYKPLYEGITDKNHPVRHSCSQMKPGLKIPIKDPILMSSSSNITIKEDYSGREQLPPNPSSVCIQSPIISSTKPNAHFSRERYNESYNGNDTDIIEPFEYPHVLPNESGWVNTSCGYNSNQIFDSNLPSNLQVGNCELTPQMKEYNKNLFTQYVQPDIFTHNEIIEPINSNIGISFTQQFEPKTFSRDENGLNYTEHDPRVFSKESKKYLDTGMTEYNIYDPRFSGYGTSYRAYTDKNLGQTKFYYDDVNSIRMPNYIARSNIDFAKYADTYGPLSDENKNGNTHTNNIRCLAQDSFLQSSIQQRESLSESLMRKRNSELWQLRKYPMRT